MFIGEGYFFKNIKVDRICSTKWGGSAKGEVERFWEEKKWAWQKRKLALLLFAWFLNQVVLKSIHVSPKMCVGYCLTVPPMHTEDTTYPHLNQGLLVPSKNSWYSLKDKQPLSSRNLFFLQMRKPEPIDLFHKFLPPVFACHLVVTRNPHVGMVSRNTGLFEVVQSWHHKC